MTLMRSFELKAATITGGLQRGDDAALFVAGTDFDGAAKKGRVIMRREGGSWRVLKTTITPLE